MIKSYLVVGFRNAIRNGMTSFINVAGLTLGVAGSMTVFIFADQFFHTDSEKENLDRVFEVTNIINRANQRVTLSDTPILLGPAMQDDNPAIEVSTRIEAGSGYVRYNDLVFNEKIWYVDPSFFRVFTFQFEEGDDRALASRKNVVIAKPVAVRYFGFDEAVGKALSIKFNNNRTEEFTVAGVIDPPAGNTLHFNILLSMDVFFDLKLKDQYDWSYLTDATFLLLKEGHQIEEVMPGMERYKKFQNESSPEWMIEEFKFYSFADLTSEGYKIESYMAGPGPAQGVIALLIISTLLLLLACFNYMKISVATIATRLKENGIRKVIGSNKREIMVQFVTENILMCAISIALGLLISYLLFMPGLVSLLGYEVPFAFSSGWSMTCFFVALLVAVVLFSGVYPAVYVSRFQPVTILKGKEKFGQKNLFSRGLLTAQFTLAFTTIVGCFVFIDNAYYLQNKDWGYDHHQHLVVPVNSTEQFLKLRDAASSRKSILSFAGSTTHMGYWCPRASFEQGGQKIEVLPLRVGFDYLETMGLRLTQGRFFDKTIQSDRVESVIVNEKFVTAMGWANPVGQTFEYDGFRRNVIGVVKDFHYQDFYQAILPVLFTIDNDYNFRYLVMKVEGGQVNQTGDWLRETWKKIAPDDPYEGILQDDAFINFNKNNRMEIKFLSFVTGMALLLACLGLFGLVSYNITRKLKEFSLRKIFGATASQIFRIMNRDYVWILSVAFLVGAPAGYFLIDVLIRITYVDPQPAGVQPFLVAIGLVFATVFFTVATQLKRVLRENPSTTLRSE